MKKLLCLAVCFIFLSCDDSKKLKRNSINVALTTNVSTLDPAVSYDTVSAEVIYQVHETLYEYDYLIRPYHLKPLLAVDLPLIDDNGLKYTIKIKKNIKYHDSKAFKGKTRYLKAQDFINQIKRLAFKPTKSNGWWLFDNKIVGLNDFRKAVDNDLSVFFNHQVEGLKAPDDHTLVIQLTKPYPQLLFALAMAFTTPIPEEVIKYKKNDLSQGSVGTGPFILKEWKKSLSLTLTRFNDYHPEFYPNKGDRISYQKKLLADKGKQLPFIDEIKFNIIKESQTRWLNFLKKKIDFIILNKDHFSIALKPDGSLNSDYKDQDIKLQIAPTLTYWWIAFNMKDSVVGKNLNLRKAIAFAIDTDRYIDIFTNKIALKANSIYPPGIPGYNPSYQSPYSYSLKKAREYMVKAGYPKGKGLPTLNYDVRGSSSTARQMGEFIKSELTKIGIKVNINMNTFPAFLNKARTGQLQFWQGGWAMDYPDAENTIQLLLSKNHSPGPNATYFSNKKLDSLFKELSKTNNQTEKFKILKKVEDIVQTNLPWIMQYYSRNYILHHGYIKNFRQSDLIFNNYKYLRLEQ
jgi:oligopeptide transport system substrate-binding protein